MNHDLWTVDLKSRDTPDWRESLISQVSEFVSIFNNFRIEFGIPRVCLVNKKI